MKVFDFYRSLWCLITKEYSIFHDALLYNIPSCEKSHDILTTSNAKRKQLFSPVIAETINLIDKPLALLI